MEGERPWRGCGGLGVTLNTDKIGFFLIKQTDTHALFEVQLWGHLKKGNHRRVGLWRKSLTPGSAPLSFLKEAKSAQMVMPSLLIIERIFQIKVCLSIFEKNLKGDYVNTLHQYVK